MQMRLRRGVLALLIVFYAAVQFGILAFSRGEFKIAHATIPEPEACSEYALRYAVQYLAAPRIVDVCP